MRVKSKPTTVAPQPEVISPTPVAISPAEIAIVPIAAIAQSDLFGELYPVVPEVEKAIAESIRKDGFRAESPLHVWEHEGQLVLLDGYTRLRVATKAGLTAVPVVKKVFADEMAALEYAMRLQRDRRQLSFKQLDAHYARAVMVLDKKLTPGARNDLKPGTKAGKSAKVTAQQIGTTVSKVEQARAVLERDNETFTAVTKGEISLARAYKKVARKPSATFDTGFRVIKDKARFGLREFNPITGYGEGYAGDVLNSLPDHLKNTAVRFWENALTVPNNVADKTLVVTGGNIVHLCSYTDLFGPFVKAEWRDQVLKICRDNPQWLFRIDTAACAVVAECDLPENTCLCMTVFRQEQVPDALRALRALREKRGAGSGPRVLALRCIPQEDMNLNCSHTDANGVVAELSLADCADWVVVSPATGDMTPCDECLAHVLLEARASQLPVYFEGNMQLAPKDVPDVLKASSETSTAAVAA